MTSVLSMGRNFSFKENTGHLRERERERERERRACEGRGLEKFLDLGVRGTAQNLSAELRVSRVNCGRVWGVRGNPAKHLMCQPVLGGDFTISMDTSERCEARWYCHYTLIFKNYG